MNKENIEVIKFPGDVVKLRKNLMPKLEKIFNLEVFPDVGPTINGGFCSFFAKEGEGRTLNKWPELSEYLEFITPHIIDFAKKSNANKEDLKLRGVWTNKFPKGSSTKRHFHTEAEDTISTLLYIQAPSGAGDLHVEFPKENDIVEIKDYKIVEGEIVIFHSSLWHWNDPNTNETPKIVIGIEVAVNPESYSFDLPLTTLLNNP